MKASLKMIEFKILSIALVIIASCHIISSVNTSKDPPKCQYDRVHKMISYDCSNIKLTAIPKYLKTSMEILDVSGNRIRKMTKDSFNNYSKLKHLYLFDNMIVKIEKGTFSPLNALETLDLSKNGLTKVPAEIFKLPNLRKLYLADNELLNNKGFDDIKKPVEAPLAYLNLVNTEIDRIPSFGVLPWLQTLVLSVNNLTQLAPLQFAYFCQLTTVDLNRTNIDLCQCHKINSFMEEELKKEPILKCGIMPSNCKINQTLTFSGPKDYKPCTEVKTEPWEGRTANISWMPLFVMCSICFFFILMIFAHCQGKPTTQPSQTEPVSYADMVVNPNSQNTLIM